MFSPPFYRDEDCGHLHFAWTPSFFAWKWRAWRERSRPQVLGLDTICHHGNVRFYESMGWIVSFKDGISTSRQDELAYVCCRDCFRNLGLVPMTESVRAAIKRDKESEIAACSRLFQMSA